LSHDRCPRRRNTGRAQRAAPAGPKARTQGRARRRGYDEIRRRAQAARAPIGCFLGECGAAATVSRSWQSLLCRGDPWVAPTCARTTGAARLQPTTSAMNARSAGAHLAASVPEARWPCALSISA